MNTAAKVLFFSQPCSYSAKLFNFGVSNQTLSIMGGEGHMLDMIKKLELNRTQRKEVGGGRFRSHKRPRITEEYLRNMESVEIEKPEEISSQKKRQYQIIAIVSLIIVVAALLFFFIQLFSHRWVFYTAGNTFKIY